MYIAYYQRPGDPSGLLYWANRLEAPGGNLEDVEAAFGNSPESQALYGPINSTTIGDVVDEIYQGLFGRLPDAAGKQFYVDGFNAGTFTPASIAFNIFVGAQNNDAVIVNNKLIAANNFSEIVDGRPFVDPQFGQGAFFNATYAGPADASAASAWLGAVDANPVTIPSPAQTTFFIQNAIASPSDPINGTSGGTFTSLTTGTDVIQITNPASVDTVLGIVATVPTFSVGDLIIGNNQTTLRLTVVNGGDAALATLANVKAVNLLAGANTTVTFDAIGWTNIGSVNVIGGTPGMFAQVDNLAPSTGFSISPATSAAIELNYLNGISVYGSNEAGGALAYDPATGSVIGSAGPGNDVYFSAYASSNAGDLTLGNVSMIGNQADSASFEVFHTDTGAGGNVTVGDVSITGFNDIDITISNSDYTGDSYDLTVGNINAATVGGSADLEIYINQENYQSDGTPAGDLTVGDITAAVGKSGSLSITLYNTGYGAGDLKVGNISATGGQSSDVEIYISHYASYSAAGDEINLGTMDIGNVAVILGVDASGSLSVYSYLSVSGADGNVGQITIGNIDLSLNVNSSFDISHSVDVTGFGGGVTTIDGITMGNITADVNDGAYLYGYALSVSNSSDGGSIGDIELGNLSLTIGVSASATLYHDIYAYGVGSSIGNYTRGDVLIDASKLSAYGYVSDYLYVDDGDMGNVTIGNVSLAAGKSADATYELNMYADNIGDIAVGNVSIAANGNSASASFSLSATATTSIGATTIGNVTMQVKGTNADGWFYVYESAGVGIGTTTIGDFDLSVGNAAKKTGASVDVFISNTVSDVVIGDIKLVGSTVRAAGDATMTYTADFYAYAGDDLTIGNIAVSGGDGAADNFANLTNWLSASAGGSVTLGDVDYSGYGAKATIDVSSFDGVGAIKGGSKADTITDNKDTNVITGGAGADTFNFVNTNTGKTLATMDQITDFTLGSDVIKAGFTVAPPGVTEYGEDNYATFSAFNSAANAGNKEVWVGNITGTGLVAAIDWNNDGTVDYMIQLVGLNNLNQIDVTAFG